MQLKTTVSTTLQQSEIGIADENATGKLLPLFVFCVRSGGEGFDGERMPDLALTASLLCQKSS